MANVGTDEGMHRQLQKGSCVRARGWQVTGCAPSGYAKSSTITSTAMARPLADINPKLSSPALTLFALSLASASYGAPLSSDLNSASSSSTPTTPCVKTSPIATNRSAQRVDAAQRCGSALRIYSHRFPAGQPAALGRCNVRTHMILRKRVFPVRLHQPLELGAKPLLLLAILCRSWVTELARSRARINHDPSENCLNIVSSSWLCLFLHDTSSQRSSRVHD